MCIFWTNNKCPKNPRSNLVGYLGHKTVFFRHNPDLTLKPMAWDYSPKSHPISMCDTSNCASQCRVHWCNFKTLTLIPIFSIITKEHRFSKKTCHNWFHFHRNSNIKLYFCLILIELYEYTVGFGLWPFTEKFWDFLDIFLRKICCINAHGFFM